MTRRRHSFPAYARRRWRVLGLLLVLLLGSLLVAVLADRGHDPHWAVRGASPVAVALSDDEDIAYSLRGTPTRIQALEAHRVSDGEWLWSSPMNDSRALLRAGPDWVAVATDFPLAFLTVFGEDNSIRYQVPLEGNPRAMAGEGDRLALALQAPGNPVLVFDGGPDFRVHRFPSFVNALDLRGGRLAVGTGQGELVVLERDGTERANLSLPMSIRSVRLSADGGHLVAGGFSVAPGDLSGLVAALDLEQDEPVIWTYATRIGVGYVDLDAAGLRALAVEEASPKNLVHVFDFARGEARFVLETEGEVAQDDAGWLGGVAMAPDGRHLAVGTIHGPLDLVRTSDGRLEWQFRIDGTDAVAFGGRGLLLVNARLSLNAPYDALLLFDTAREPLLGRLGLVSLGLATLAVATGAATLAIGYARLRRA